MKRFTSLMLMLLVAVTTWAQALLQITTDTSNPIYYTIYNTRSDSPGGFIYYAGDDAGLKDGCTASTIENKYKFYFTGSDDALYVHNAATTKKLASVTSWTDEGAVWCVIKRTDGNLAFGPQNARKDAQSWWNEQNDGRDGYTEWDAEDAGSGFVVEPVDNFVYPEVGKFYTIEAPLFEKVQNVKKGLVANGGNALGWNTVDLANKNFYWTLVEGENGELYLQNVGTGKYINGDAVKDEKAALTTNALGSNQFNIVTNNVKLHASGHNGGKGSNGGVVGWNGAANSASAWKFVEQEDPNAVTTLDITYNFTYNGANKVSQTKTVRVGDEYPDIEVSFPFGISATKPSGVVTADSQTEYTIELQENLPFKYADSDTNIKNWYYVQMHSSGGSYTRFLQYVKEGETTYIEWLDTEKDVNNLDTYTWAFIGDPFTGFKMVNYGAPNGANAVVSNGSGNPSFGDIADAVAWDIKASRTNNDATHFCFQYREGEKKYMNAQSGKVAFWGDNDQGSTMWVTERDLTGLADLKALIGQIEAAVAAYGQGGTTVGYYTAESTAALLEALANAKTAAEANTSAAANTAAQAALQAAVDALKTIQPVEGKFYRIASHCTKDHRNAQEIYVSKDGDMHFAHVADNKAAGTIGHIFQFVPAQDGKFYIYNVQRGVYMKAVGGQGTPAVVTSDKNSAKPVAIKNLGVGNVIGIYPDGQSMMHAQDDYSKIVGWNETNVNDGSAWVINEVDIDDAYQEVAVSEVGYATLCLGYNATIPAGVEAYIAKADGIGNGNISLTQVEGVLPANEAVILKLAEGASAGTFNFVYAASAKNVEGNLFEGTTVDTNITNDAYVLGVVDGVVGLYNATKNINTDTTNDGTEEEPAVTYEAWKNNANKAYLPANVVPVEEQGAAYYSFRFEDGTTAIENVEVESAVNVIYDLTGRRVEAITAPGIYIVNGKKTLVK